MGAMNDQINITVITEVIHMTDADVVMVHTIQGNLTTYFFYRDKMPELIDRDISYMLQPPLYKAKKGQNKEPNFFLKKKKRMEILNRQNT